MKIHLLKHWERYSSICEAEEEMDAETGAIAERLVSKGEIIDPREIRRPIIVKRSEQKKMGDLAHWWAIVLSQRAVDALHPLLENNGVFYPLEGRDLPQPYWLFNLTNIIDCLDEDRSEGSVNNYRSEKHPEKYVTLRRIAFKRELFEGRDTSIFKIPHYRNRYVFVNDEFRAAVEKNRLVGFALAPEGEDSRIMIYEDGVVLNKNIKPLDNFKITSRRTYTVEQWIAEVEAVVKNKNFAELNTVRKSIHEKYAFKQDDEGLRDFYRKVAGLVMNEKEKELLFHYELFSEEGVFVSDLKAAIRKIRQAFSENKKLKAVYFEYYDGECNFFLCDDYDRDSDDWCCCFDGKNGVVIGADLPVNFRFDDDFECSEFKRTVGLEILDGLMAAQLIDLWKSMEMKMPLSYAQHDSPAIRLKKK